MPQKQNLMLVTRNRQTKMAPKLLSVTSNMPFCSDIDVMYEGFGSYHVYKVYEVSCFLLHLFLNLCY